MNIVVYNVLDSEKSCYTMLQKKYGINFILSNEAPSHANIKLAHSTSAVCVLTTPISSNLIDAFYAEGVRYIVTRSVGYDHMDICHAKQIGMSMGHSSYSPNNVAEYAVMLMLMASRNVKTVLNAFTNQDFSLRKIQSSLLSSLTIGIIGTGKIGSTVAKMLQGFGCKILAFDPYPNESLKNIVTYLPLDKIYSNSDLISLHLPATADNQHMINEASIKNMKHGMIIVNTARGSLIDTNALIDALESKILGGAALDVIEDETNYYYNDFKNEVIPHRNMAILRAMPNVILTPHTAFYSKQSIDEVVSNAVASCMAEIKGENNPWKIV